MTISFLLLLWICKARIVSGYTKMRNLLWNIHLKVIYSTSSLRLSCRKSLILQHSLIVQTIVRDPFRTPSSGNVLFIWYSCLICFGGFQTKGINSHLSTFHPFDGRLLDSQSPSAVCSAELLIPLNKWQPVAETGKGKGNGNRMNTF